MVCFCYEIDNDSKCKTYKMTRLSFPWPPATHLFTLYGQLILLVVYLSSQRSFMHKDTINICFKKEQQETIPCYVNKLRRRTMCYPGNLSPSMHKASLLFHFFFFQRFLIDFFSKRRERNINIDGCLPRAPTGDQARKPSTCPPEIKLATPGAGLCPTNWATLTRASVFICTCMAYATLCLHRTW